MITDKLKHNAQSIVFAVLFLISLSPMFVHTAHSQGLDCQLESTDFFYGYENCVWEITDLNAGDVKIEVEAGERLYFVNKPLRTGEKYFDLVMVHMSDSGTQSEERFTGFKPYSPENKYTWSPELTGIYTITVKPNVNHPSEFNNTGTFRFLISRSADLLD